MSDIRNNEMLTILDNMRAIFKSLRVASVDRSAAVAEFGRLLATRDLDLNLPIHNEEEGRSIGNSLLGECIYLLLCHGRCSYKNETTTNACVRMLIIDRRVDVNREFAFGWSTRQLHHNQRCPILVALYSGISPLTADLLPILLDRPDLRVSQPFVWHNFSTTLLGLMIVCKSKIEDLEIVRRLAKHERFDVDLEDRPLHDAAFHVSPDFVDLLLDTPTVGADQRVPHNGREVSPLDIAMKYEGTKYYSAQTRILRALLDSPRIEAPRRVNLVDRPPSSPVVKTILQSARFDVHQFVGVEEDEEDEETVMGRIHRLLEASFSSR